MFDFIYVLCALLGPFATAYWIHQSLVDMILHNWFSRAAGVFAFLGICTAIMFSRRYSPQVLMLKIFSEPGKPNIGPYFGLFGFGVCFAIAGFPNIFSIASGKPKPLHLIRRVGVYCFAMAWTAIAFLTWMLYRQEA